MSIIIKSNQLNTLIYKYLLEAGLTHTAYTMFNEAKLQNSLQQFKFDIKSGHLLMLLQKALIFNQIQAHVNFSEYKECLEPFYLLKTHTCKITQKIKQEKQNFLKQLNNNITECIKRTNAIYNTELPSKIYDEIVYEPRGTNFFEKFHKVRYNQNNSNENKQSSMMKIDAFNQEKLVIYNKDQKLIYLTHNDIFNEETKIEKVYPCTIDGILENAELLKLTFSHLIVVFKDNKVKIINLLSEQNPFIFTIQQFKHQISEISANDKFPNLILFRNQHHEYYIINLQNLQQIKSGCGIIEWRSFDQYVIYENNKLALKSLLKDQDLLTYNLEESEVDEIRISKNKTFFYVTNFQKGKIFVFTFEKQEPLYSFNFAHEDQQLKDVLWIWRSQVDYLAILTDCAVRVWEVQFNAYCLKIDLQKYDSGEITKILSLQHNDQETFLIALGSENLIVSDIANQKVERIQAPQSCRQMFSIGKSSIAVINNQYIYFLSGEKLAELFK